jgi:hypothetical protein
MRIIKLLVLLLLWGALIASFPLYFNKTVSSCDKPLHFKIDHVDTKFGISREEFKKAAVSSADLWSKASGRALFISDEGGPLSVNLVYDERQAQLSRIQRLEGNLEKNQGRVEKEGADYEARVADFEKRLAKFNSEVDHYNNQGGAPATEFERLSKEQQILNSEAAKLNDEAKKLNKQANDFNAQVKDLNSEISSFNQSLHDKPEGGIYDGSQNRIEIYLAADSAELSRILAHEFGHALGIGHVSSENSIMFPLSISANKLSADDLAALREVCKGHKNWEILFPNRNFSK